MKYYKPEMKRLEESDHRALYITTLYAIDSQFKFLNNELNGLRIYIQESLDRMDAMEKRYYA